MIRSIQSILNDDNDSSDFDISAVINNLKSSTEISESIDFYLYNEETENSYELTLNKWEINNKTHTAIFVPQTEVIIGYFVYYTSQKFTDRKFSDPFKFGNVIIDMSRSGIKVANLELVWFADNIHPVVPNIRADLIFQALIFNGDNDAVVIKAPTFKSEYLNEAVQLIFSFEECSITITHIQIQNNDFEYNPNHIESMDEYHQIITNSTNQIDLTTSSLMVIKSGVYQIGDTL